MVDMKALFVLRHYNDIDHVTPVISKWIEAGHTGDVVLIGNPKFLHDYRIKFLDRLNGVRVAHIRDSAAATRIFELATADASNNLRRLFIAPLVDALARIYNAKRREPIWRSTTRHLLERSFKGIDEGVVVFD